MKKATSRNIMKRKLNALLMKILKPYLEKGDDPHFTIENKGKKTIELRTDSLVYDFIYDPSTSDIPSLGYKIQDKFSELVKKNGWSWEAEGGGVITLYPWL